MSYKNDQPAFPMQDVEINRINAVQGLTKREYFAAMALQGMLSNPSLTDDAVSVAESKVYNVKFGKELIAEFAIQAADELLKQLEQ